MLWTSSISQREWKSNSSCDPLTPCKTPFVWPTQIRTVTKKIHIWTQFLLHRKWIAFHLWMDAVITQHSGYCILVMKFFFSALPFSSSLTLLLDNVHLPNPSLDMTCSTVFSNSFSFVVPQVCKTYGSVNSPHTGRNICTPGNRWLDRLRSWIHNTFYTWPGCILSSNNGDDSGHETNDDGDFH